MNPPYVTDDSAVAQELRDEVAQLVRDGFPEGVVRLLEKDFKPHGNVAYKGHSLDLRCK